MKKILIVVPGCRTGGVLSSLIALLNSTFVERYDIHLFVMNTYGEQLQSELAKFSIGKNLGTSLLNANVVNSSGIRKLILILFKLILQMPFLGKLFSNCIEISTIRSIEKDNYDCVISFQESASLPFVAKFSNPNKIAWIHCDYSRIFTNKMYEFAVFSKYCKIVTVSEYTRVSFCKLLPSLESRVVVIYNIMDSSAIIQKSKEQMDDDRFCIEEFTIISVGRISAVKQFNLIPSIASSLKTRGLAFKWYILGGKHEIEPYQKLMQAISDYSVENEVICLGNKTNPYPYFKVADLLVSTSSSEACPMIFNEAKILNLPVVTNNFGSAHEFIVEGQDGQICSLTVMADVIDNIIRTQRRFNPHISTDFDEQHILSQIDKLLI